MNSQISKAISVTDHTFEEILTSNSVVLIDFFADWCGPCKMLAPIIDELATDYFGKAFVGKMDIDSNPKIASQYSIRSIPTLLLFHNGVLVDTIQGAVEKTIIEKKINTYIKNM